MGLIKCPECGKAVSDKAEICVNCGFPLRKWIESERKKEDKKGAEKNSIIICEYCGSDRIDKEGYCDECGMKVSSSERQYSDSEVDIEKDPYTICPDCGTYNKAGEFRCKNCGHQYLLNEYKVICPEEHTDFQGIYKQTLFNGLQEVRCPRCGSENCSHYQEQHIVPAKIKTRYTVNLNPLKPFTLVNKKEKINRNEEVITKSRFLCNKCGKIFD